MLFLTCILFIYVPIINCGSPFRQLFKDRDLTVPPGTNGTGEALFLTPIIQNGDIKTAQAKSRVWGISKSLQMYSGYITVNKKYNSNLFFWFIQAENMVRYIHYTF